MMNPSNSEKSIDYMSDSYRKLMNKSKHEFVSKKSEKSAQNNTTPIKNGSEDSFIINSSILPGSFNSSLFKNTLKH